MNNRYIPSNEKTKLLSLARNRCCVMGHIVFNNSDDVIPSDAILDKHHVIYLSENGENNYENLIVVCANCHKNIHAHPTFFTTAKLKSAKLHWEDMFKLIPPNLTYENIQIPDSLMNIDKVNIQFKIEALNLKYNISVPNNLKIKDLSIYIINYIIRPLLLYSKLSPFKYVFSQFEIKNTQLVLDYNRYEPIDENLSIDKLSLTPETYFLANLEIIGNTVFMQASQYVEIKLTWSKLPTDLDLHLVIFEDDIVKEIDFRNPGNLYNYPFAVLSEDITTGFGPEHIKFSPLSEGKYIISVHNFSKEVSLSKSEAILEVRLKGENLKFNCPNLGNGTIWDVLKIDCSDNSIEEINILR